MQINIVVIVVVHELYHQLCCYDAILPIRFCQGVQDKLYVVLVFFF